MSQAARPPGNPSFDCGAAERLVARIGAGDRQAEQDLVAVYGRAVALIVSRHTNGRPEAEDLYQDTFRIAFEKLRGGELRDPARLPAFLAGIARNLAIDYYRKSARRKTSFNTDAVVDCPAGGMSQFDRLARQERAKLIRRVIHELSTPRDREILYRFYISEEDKREIAADYGLPSRERRDRSQLLVQASFVPDRRGAGRGFDPPYPSGGIRFTYIKTKDGEWTKPPTKPNASFAGFSLRFSLGFEIGAAVVAGVQQVPAGHGILPDGGVDLPTLYVVNEATGEAVMQIGQTATLKVTLTPPQGGKNDPVTLQSNGTSLALTMPDFLQDTVQDMTVNPPSGWKSAAPTDGTLNLTYVGADQSWQQNLVFTIDNVKSDSSDQDQGSVVALMDGTSLGQSIRASSALELVPLTFAASIDWQVNAESGFQVDSPASGTNVAANSPPTSFVGLTTVTDNKGVQWSLGYQFSQSDSGSSIVPTMQAVWWKADTPYLSKNLYTSPNTPLTGDPVTITAYYGDVQGSANNLTIKATLVAPPE